MKQIELDQEVFDDLKDLMGEGFQSFLQKYYRNTETYLQDLESALGNQDLLQARSAIHNLKSSNGAIGFSDLQEVAENLEAILLESEEIPASFTEQFPRFKNLQERAREHIQIYINENE